MKATKEKIDLVVKKESYLHHHLWTKKLNSITFEEVGLVSHVSLGVWNSGWVEENHPALLLDGLAKAWFICCDGEG